MVTTLFFKIFKYFRGLSFSLLGLLLIASGCTGGSGNADGTTITDDDIDLGSPDDFTPTDNSTPIESPEENCDTTQSPSISTSSIDFGLNELEGEECQTITINGCYSFSAEFSSSTHATFDLYTSSGGRADGKLSDQTDSVTVCNNRSEEGTHTGRLTIVIDSGSSAYTFVVNLTSQTVGYMFDITSPTENFAVWEKTATKKTADDGSEYFELSAKGIVNVAELSSIISANTIAITTTVESQSVSYDSSSGSFSTTMKFDSSPAQVSNMDFTIETGKGNITKSIPLIRFTAPTGTVQVLDTTGNVISSAETTPNETDNPQLTSGISVENLDVSGPNSSLPVHLSLSVTKAEDGTTTEIFSDKEIYAGIDYGSGEGSCSSYFTSPDSTFCYTLPDISEFGKGTNTLKATLCNDYTAYYSGSCTTTTTVIVVDNDVPVANLTSPVDNQLYDVEDDITFSGTLENFLLYETLYELQEQVNAETGETEEVQVEIGKECAVDLWVNTDIGVTIGEGDAKETVEIDLCDSITVTHNEDSNTTNGNSGNTRKAEFTYTLSPSGVNGYHVPTLYTNQALLRVQDANGKIIYKVVSFQRGLKNKATMKYTTSSGAIKMATTGELVIGKLGEVTNTGSTTRAPIMLHVSEATLNPSASNDNSAQKLIYVIEKMLNDPENGLKFGSILQGGTLPGDDNGNNQEDENEDIDFESQFDYETGEDFWDLSKEEQDNQIWQWLHGSMPAKVRALTRYRTQQNLEGKISLTELDSVFFEQEGDPFTEYNVALNACGDRITTSLNTYNLYQYIYKEIGPVEDIPYVLQEWTSLCGYDNLDCDSTYQGKWKIGNIDLKDEGYLDVDLCLLGEGEWNDINNTPNNPCDDEAVYDFTSSDVEHMPGYWSLVGARNLIESGITTYEHDPILSLIWNVVKIRIQAKDAIQIIKDGDGNKLVIREDKFTKDSITLEPYLECKDYFRKQYGDDYELPYGCDPSGNVYPVLSDPNSPAGQVAANDMGMEEDDNMFLLSILRDELTETVANMVNCMDDELVNPFLNPSVFEFPPWTPDDVKISELKLALDDAEDGLTLTMAEDAVNPVFTFSPDIVNADINIFNGGLTLKLPLQFSVTDVSTFTMLSMLNSASSATTRSNGHMYREPSEANFESDHPLMAENNVVYLSASLGAEEFLNSILFAVFKRGPLYYVDLVDEELADDLNIANNYQVEIDNVILGRFGICGNIDIITTDLAPTLLFSKISNYFESDSFTHLDILLQKDYSPTLAILPHPEDPTNPDLAIVQVGLPNLQINVKNHSEITDENGEVRYEVGDTVFRMRADILLKLIIKTVEENGRVKLEIYIPPFNEQAFYFSMANRGNVLNDEDAFSDIRETVLESNMWPKFASTYDPSSDSNVPSVSITLPQMVSGFSDVENVNLSTLSEEEQEAMSTFEGLLIDNRIAEVVLGECEDGEEPLYVGEEYTSEDSDEDSGSSSSSSSGGMVKNINIGEIAAINSGIVGKMPEIDLQDLTDPCSYDNDIKEALCDMGIDDITFGTGYPNLYLDYNNGYIHFDVSLFVSILDTLLEEVSTDL